MRVLILVILFINLTLISSNFTSISPIILEEELNLEVAMHKTTKKFIENFFEYEFLTPDCQLEDYIDDIFEYSFKMGNYLGDYSGCLKKTNNMTYLFFIYIHNDTSINNKLYSEEGFSFYFKDLIFYEYYLFSICVPKCIKFKTNERVNPFNIEEDKNKTFFLKFYDTQEIYSKYIDSDRSINLFIFITYAIFFVLSLFFALIPSYEIFTNLQKSIFCCCNGRKGQIRKSRLQLGEDFSLEVSQLEDEKLKAMLRNNRESNTANLMNLKNDKSLGIDMTKYADDNKSSTSKDKNFTMEDTEFIDQKVVNNENKNNINKLYKIISSIFSLSKNIKRIFKATNVKNKTTSSYINDNSTAFLNGLKGINLICMTYCSIFWIFIDSPNSNSNYSTKEKIFTNNFFILSFLYYLYWSIHATYALNGFSFGYKFLCHMNNKNYVHDEKNKTNAFKKVFSFVAPQFYRYPLYIFLLFNVHNIHCVMNFGLIKSSKAHWSGPLFFIYKEISNYTFEKLYHFLLLYANFEMQDKKFTKTSIFVFFFVYLNEIHYFFLILIILIVYHYKSNLGYILLILAYLVTTTLRALYSILFEPDEIGAYGDIRDFFGFEIYSFHFLYGFPVYIIGVIFGVLYYEYNIVDDIGINNQILLDDSFIAEQYDHLNYSQYLKKMENHNRGRVFIKFLAKSVILLNVIIMLIFVVLLSFILLDIFYLFPNITAEGFTNYKYKTWDKLYSFLELDFLSIFIFLMTFKFAIFHNREFKKFLESNFWIPFNRLYFVIACLLSPITYFFVLNLEYPIDFTYANVFFLSISVLFMLYLICFFISLIIEVPLKVGFKKIINHFLNDSSLEKKVSQVDLWVQNSIGSTNKKSDKEKEKETEKEIYSKLNSKSNSFSIENKFK